MTVRFFRSGVLETQTKMGSIDSKKNGTWEFVSLDEPGGIMKLKCVLAGQATEHEIEFIDSSKIKWIPPNMAGTTRQLTFERSR